MIGLNLLVLAAGMGPTPMRLSSPDLGTTVPMAAVFNDSGCSGENIAPRLTWRSVPKGVKSFAVTVFDPDAPTGHGWWHWLVTDIPSSATGLFAGPNGTRLPAGAKNWKNDFGTVGYGGPCPPPGPAHRYVFTLYALRRRVSIPSGASPITVDGVLRANALATAKLVSRYGR